MTEAYPDITDGSQVTVTCSSGTVMGTSTLSYSKADTFSFLVQADAKYPQIGQSLSSESPPTGSRSGTSPAACPGTASLWARGWGPSG
jgi:hypothetical protein